MNDADNIMAFWMNIFKWMHVQILNCFKFNTIYLNNITIDYYIVSLFFNYKSSCTGCGKKGKCHKRKYTTDGSTWWTGGFQMS